MKIKHGLTTAFALALISMMLVMPTVYAITMTVSPKTIPKNGIVTITVSGVSSPPKDNEYPLKIESLQVKDPNGVVYTYGPATWPVTIASGSWSTTYGTGVADWSPAADTSIKGEYIITVNGKDLAGTPRESVFSVTNDFWQTPEFGSVIAATSLGLVGIALIKRRKNTA